MDFPLVIAASALGASILAYVIGKHHVRLFSTLVVGSLLFFIGLAFFVLEIVFLVSTPFRLLFFTKKTNKRVEEQEDETSVKIRKIVLFDGVCVLCNRAGQFVVAHLPDPAMVNFVPIQHALYNPHVNLARIKAEFPDFKEEMISEKICVISAGKMYWGADSIAEVCSWMYFPFPVVTLVSNLFPRFLKDIVYSTVSRNRYDWFGTQPLENHFAKNMCPYLAVKKFLIVEEPPADVVAKINAAEAARR